MRFTAFLATGLAAVAVPAHAAGLTDLARNPHHYTLKLDMLTFVNGNWQGDANFAISACPQAACFHLSGSLLFPDAGEASAFSIPQQQCDLHFAEVEHRGMDSGDYRITLVNRARKGNGCASLPPAIAGVYKEVPSLSGQSQPQPRR